VRLAVALVVLVACGSSKTDRTEGSPEQRTRRAAALEQTFRERGFPTTVTARDRTLFVRKLDIAGEDFCRANTVELWLTWSADPQNVKAIVPQLDQPQLVAAGFRRIECETADGKVWGADLPYDAAKRALPILRTTDKHLTEVHVKKLAFEAYPQWAAANPSVMCPPAIRDLLAYVHDGTSLDAWGNPLRMACGEALPAGAKGLAIHSLGPDGVDGTADDIKSWE
jgi:hypothetical protein